jgi:hypothetical protein
MRREAAAVPRPVVAGAVVAVGRAVVVAGAEVRLVAVVPRLEGAVSRLAAHAVGAVRRWLRRAA